MSRWYRQPAEVPEEPVRITNNEEATSAVIRVVALGLFLLSLIVLLPFLCVLGGSIDSPTTEKCVQVSGGENKLPTVTCYIEHTSRVGPAFGLLFCLVVGSTSIVLGRRASRICKQYELENKR